ncbi:MAG: sulfurtransferase [Casimicrobiaceae bacterium]
MSDAFGPLVSTAWLEEHLAAADLRILDCTMRLVPFGGGVRADAARDAWAEGHIPGSAYVDLRADLSDRSSAFPLMMPPAAQFAAVMSALGVDRRSRVVLYDAGGHSWATRLWWMLRAVGFDRAAVLDGGLAQWKAQRRPMSTQPPHHAPTQFVALPRPGVFVDRRTVASALGRADTRLVNALSADEHAGRVSRAARPGRIPGSVNVPAATLVEAAPGGFLPVEQLRERFAASRALEALRVIVYCGGGISATADAFSLVRLGARDVAVYDGSLAEWSADPTLPLETD